MNDRILKMNFKVEAGVKLNHVKKAIRNLAVTIYRSIVRYASCYVIGNANCYRKIRKFSIKKWGVSLI